MKRALGAGLALLLALLLLAWLSVDLLLQRAVEAAARNATGLPARVEGTRLRLLGGELKLQGLTLQNPAGFASPFLFRLDQLTLEVRPRSLLDATVQVPRLVIRGVVLHLERDGARSNIDPVLERLRRGDTDRPAGKERRFVIGTLRIADVRAEALLAKELQAAPHSVVLEPIVLRDVGADSGGVTASQLSRLVIAEVLEQARGRLPLPAEWRQRLEQAGALDERARERAQQAIEERKRELLEQGERLLQGR